MIEAAISAYNEGVEELQQIQYTDYVGLMMSSVTAIINANPKNEKRDLQWVRENAVIIHYYGKNKPWKDDYSGILGIFYQYCD